MQRNAPENQKIALTDQGVAALHALEEDFKDVENFGTVNECLTKLWESLNRDLESAGYDRIELSTRFDQDEPSIDATTAAQQGNRKSPRGSGASGGPGGVA